METATYMMGAVAVGLGFVAAIFADGNHRSAVLWVCWLAIILTATAGACWYQLRIWSQQEEARRLNSASNRPWLNLVEPRISRKIAQGEPICIEVACKNTGGTPGTIIAKGMCGGTANTIEDVHERVAALMQKVVIEGHKMSVPVGTVYWMRGSDFTLANLEFSKTRIMFIGGLVVYTDTTGIPRYETEFCFLYDWPSEQFYCDEKHSRMT